MDQRKYTKKIGDFIIGRTIGQGTFGKVKQGTHAPTGKKVAIKILQKSKITQRQDLTRVHNQLKILYKKVSHPNIIKLLQLHQSPTTVYIITQYIQGTQLYNLIVEKKALNYQLCGIYLCQLLSAVEYLHSIGICHRDIKPENIIVDGGKLMLIDFGLSKQFGAQAVLETSCGSPCYAAPEMLAGRKYNCKKSDVWAIGVTLYAMAAGHLPFQHQNTDRLYQIISTGVFPPIQKIMSPSTPSYLPPSSSSSSSSYTLSKQSSLHFINSLLEKCLKVNPNQRIQIKEIKQNVWVKQWYSYLQQNKREYESDCVLIESMRKYFGVGEKQIRHIVDTKEIMSISTYYYLNLKETCTRKQQKQGNYHQGQTRKQFNSPPSHLHKPSPNPQSHTKSIHPNCPISPSSQPLTPSPHPKNKSMTLNPLTSPPSILQQIQKNRPKNINYIGQPEYRLLQKQFYEHSQKTNINMNVNVNGKQENGMEVFSGGFHLGLVFGSVEEVYEYAKAKFDKIGDQEIIREEEEDGCESEQEEAYYSQVLKYRKPVVDHETQSQQQYIVQNNKYILNSPPKPHKQDTPSQNSIIEPTPNKQKLQLFPQNNEIEYKGVRLKIKQIENIGMYYLELPPYFIF